MWHASILARALVHGGVATHMQRAHACRGRRGSSRERPRQLRLAQRLVRAAHALQPPSGRRESSALLGAARAMQSRRARRLTPASKSAQPAGGPGCADLLSASWRPTQRDCIKHGAAPESSPRSTIDFTPAGPPYWRLGPRAAWAGPGRRPRGPTRGRGGSREICENGVIS